MISVLVRKQREGAITSAELQNLRRSFVAHTRDQYVVVEFEARVLNRARNLLVTYPLRTLDALQLSSALSAASIGRKKPIFVSADARLLNAAAAEGLPTDDPNLHP
jgi:hypothetical protein